MKKVAIITILLLIVGLSIKFLYTKPQKVLIVGRLMGFEIDSEIVSNKSENIIATSSKKIGTVTFIKKETNDFVALGHSTVKDRNRKVQVIGICYDVQLDGINKGTVEQTGNIKATLNQDSKLGYVRYDSSYGVFGKIEQITEEYEEVETGCWYEVKKGKGNILIALDEDELVSYEVEITGIDYINNNKNIKVKVTDKDLIEKTGGIIQGMSGAPLMQNREINRSNKLC